MKDYLLISNTKENKISDFYLNLLLSHIEKSTNEKFSFRISKISEPQNLRLYRT